LQDIQSTLPTMRRDFRVIPVLKVIDAISEAGITQDLIMWMGRFNFHFQMGPSDFR